MSSTKTLSTKPQGVHLVGSVPLDTSEEVFATVGPALGNRLRRMPDGETGNRQHWVQFQLYRLAELDDFELIDFELPGVVEKAKALILKEGVDPETVSFGDLGYADIASRSYAAFQAAQDAGQVPRDVRFQVSLPTPLANGIGAFGSDPSFPTLMRRYEAAMLDELAGIVDAVPADRLAIQWDVCFELLMYEDSMPIPAGYDRRTIAEHVVRVSNAVPAGVEMGHHYCFGDLDHKHTKEPDDLGRTVELLNTVVAGIERQLDFVHLPVPIERDDDAYFAPLSDLEIAPETEIYVGLVHMRDGVEGGARRLAAASKVLDQFGLATECGWGRRPAGRGGGDDFAQLLELHRQLADPVK